MLKLGLKPLGDKAKALAAQQQANRIAKALVQDLGAFFVGERVDGAALEAAAFELGETIGTTLDAAFLVHQRLDPDAIRRALLNTRPVAIAGMRTRFVHPADRALAPRLRAVAPEQAGCELEQNARLLQQSDEVARTAPQILEELRAVRPAIEDTADIVQEIAGRLRKIAERRAGQAGRRDRR